MLYGLSPMPQTKRLGEAPRFGALPQKIRASLQLHTPKFPKPKPHNTIPLLSQGTRLLPLLPMPRNIELGIWNHTETCSSTLEFLSRG